MLRFLLQEFAQQKGLLREPLGTRVLGKKIKKLVPKYRRATWLEHHDWHPGFDLGSKGIQSPQQQFLGPVQHAKVTSPGAIDATRAQMSIFPNAYALSGRIRPS